LGTLGRKGREEYLFMRQAGSAPVGASGGMVDQQEIPTQGVFDARVPMFETIKSVVFFASLSPSCPQLRSQQ
jgi:hypothetical protein